MSASALDPEEAYEELLPHVLERVEEGETFTAAGVCPEGYTPRQTAMYLSRLVTVCSNSGYVIRSNGSHGEKEYSVHDMEGAREGIDTLKHVEEDDRTDRELADHAVRNELGGGNPTMEEVVNLLSEQGIGRDIPRRMDIAQEILE